MKRRLFLLDFLLLTLWFPLLYMNHSAFGEGQNNSDGGKQSSAKRSPEDGSDISFSISVEGWRNAWSEHRYIITNTKQASVIATRSIPHTALWGTAEGHYLGVILPEDFDEISLDKAKVVRSHVTSVDGNESVIIKVNQHVVKHVKEDQLFLLIRPLKSSTDQMNRIPHYAQVRHITLFSKMNAEERRVVTMADNLRKIIRAMYEFHELHEHLPPAIVYGPDGKPWHSWRVILAAELGDPAVRNYRFNEPWNSPHNRRVINQCPEYYRYPGDDSGNTAFSVVIGKHTAFPPEGVKFNGTIEAFGNLYTAPKNYRKLSEFIDGPSNTILIGAIDETRTVPWTKPEDIRVSDEFTVFDDKKAYAASFRKNDQQYGLFGMADGNVIGLPDDIENRVMRNMLTVDGLEGPELQLPTISVGKSKPSKTIISFEKSGGETICIIEEVE